MGNTHSSASNTINSYVQECLNESSSAVQNCSSQLSNNQSLTIVGTSGNVDIENLDWSQYSQLNSSCIADQKSAQDLKNKIANTFQQNAKAITQALSLNLNTNTDTKNITNTVQQLGESISSTFLQECAQNVFQSQSVDVKDTKGNVTFKAIKWSQGLDAMNKCAQTSSNVTTLSTSIEDAIGQVATSVEKNILSFLSGFVFLIIAIVIGIIYMLYKTIENGENVLTSPWLYVGIFLLVDSYFVIGYFYGWAPYKSEDRVLPIDQENAQAHNKKVLVPVAIINAVSFLIFGIWIKWHVSQKKQQNVLGDAGSDIEMSSLNSSEE